MARKPIFKHATQVDTGTYPDDGVSPIGSNEWNEAPSAQGMLGFSPQTSTITISSNNLVVTDSVCVATSGSSSDTINTIDIANTNEYDVLYLYAASGKTITLTHTSSPSSNGHIYTISEANETLSSTKPTILMRKGNYWYGYGGGQATNITNSQIASNAAIAYSKLNLSGSIVNADISTSAAIATSKLAALTASRALVSDGSGVITPSAVTSTELGYVSGVTSAIQTQLDAKQAAASAVTLTGTETLTNKTLTSAVLTTPSIVDGGAITDDSGNEYIKVSKVATAVNEVTVKNNSTTNYPEIQATGGDSNIGIKFVPKGTGAVYGAVETIEVPLSSDSATSAPSTGVIYTSLPMPAGFNVIGVVGGVKTAGTGANLVRFDVLVEDTAPNTNTFTTIFSTNGKPTIDASEFTTTTATTAYALSSNPTVIPKGHRVQYKIDQIDSNSLARGYKIGLVGYYTAKPSGL